MTPDRVAEALAHRLYPTPIWPLALEVGWHLSCQCGYGGRADSPEAAVLALAKHMEDAEPEKTVPYLPERYAKALEVVEAARRFLAAEEAYHHLVAHADGRPGAKVAMRAALAAFDEVAAVVTPDRVAEGPMSIDPFMRAEAAIAELRQAFSEIAAAKVPYQQEPIYLEQIAYYYLDAMERLIPFAAEVQTQNQRGEWVPSIPEPLFFGFRLRRCQCLCGRQFRDKKSYQGHYALVHIWRRDP